METEATAGPRHPPDRQGDVIALSSLTVVTGEDSLDTVRVPTGLVVVLTQTCDLVRPSDGPDPRPYAVVAPLVKLDPRMSLEAQRGRRPRFVSVPWAGPDFAADLEVCQTVDKGFLQTRDVVASPRNDEDARRFAYAVGRKWSRPALPDDVQEALRPLLNRVRKKTGHRQSPEGRILDDIAGIRVEVDPDWNADSIEVRIVLLVPGLPPDDPDNGPQPGGSTQGDAEAITRIAAQIDGARERELVDPRLWHELADALAGLCSPNGRIVSIRGEAVSTSRFGYDRLQQSDELDLEYLSVRGNR